VQLTSAHHNHIPAIDAWKVPHVVDLDDGSYDLHIQMTRKKQALADRFSCRGTTTSDDLEIQS
jgi:hypothetical protein